MKTTLALLAVPFLATSALIAQDGPKEGQELLDLFERMHRDGATEADLRKLLGDKTLLDLEVPDAAEKRDESPEASKKFEEAFRKNAERGQVRKLEIPEAAEAPAWRIGLIIDPIPQVVRDHFALGRNEGMRIFQVMNGSPAHRLGLQVNDIILSAGDKKIGSIEDLKEVVERAGREDEPLKLTWIHRGERRNGKLRPEGPPQAENDEQAVEESKQRAMMRRMEEMARKMEIQQREIEELRREIERLQRESKADE